VTVLEFPDVAAADRTACLSLYSRLAAGVTVVAASGVDGPTGMTASSVTSVSLEPPLLLVSLAQQSRTLAAILARRSFAVHLLRSDQRALAERFSGGAGPRFRGLPHRTVLGAPVLGDVLGWSVCRLEAEHSHGDHTLVIGRVVAAGVGTGRPLLWHDRSFMELAS
jgi:flavin reductase (DIM6/NTAB) family NADH-FMN oxidoreductase RutF